MSYKYCQCGNSFFTSHSSQKLCVKCQKELEVKPVEVKPFLKIKPRYHYSFLNYIKIHHRRLYNKLENRMR